MNSPGRHAEAILDRHGRRLKRVVCRLRRGHQGYITDAERYGWSFVFGGLLPADFEPTRGAAQAPGGAKSSAQTGATWRVHTPPSTIV